MRKNLFFMIAVFALVFQACSDDDGTMDLNITGLEDLGSEAIYEGWIIVDGSPVSTGTFSVDVDGTLSKTSFDVAQEDLDAASTFVLTVEPSPDPDAGPSDVHILAGDISGTSSNLTIAHGAALGNDFSSAAGSYILATPTNADLSDEASGIWFLDNSSGAPAVGLTLPTLPAGWAYEGWAVINGTPVSTGTFLTATGADDAATYSGDLSGPPFPGEDFLNNEPGDLSFPTDLRGGTAVISIEPVPDNSAAPFVLKPLVGAIEADAPDHTALSMGANLTFPTGTVTIK